jgi:glycosyltransferase involved in cell wall biosynthesis
MMEQTVMDAHGNKGIGQIERKEFKAKKQLKSCQISNSDSPEPEAGGCRINDSENETLISILLPNLNNRPFLEERIESVFKQTIDKWELVIVDNFSEDGAWEFFKQLAAKDPRIRARQAPREGMYANWNNCIRMAKGKYVYIATSDDTMAEDCLEKLSKALVQHPECGLAHCPLKLFDQHSKEIADNWWWQDIFAQSAGDLIHRRHIRKAPFDGLLHLAGRTVYISITQLLIQRSLFETVGLFPTNRGSIGDFQWDMKAALLTDTIHVPDTWGGWRQHENQATARSGRGSLEHLKAVESMSWCALSEVAEGLSSQFRKFVESGDAMLNIRKRRISKELDSRDDFLEGLGVLASQIRKFPLEVIELSFDKVAKKLGVNRERITSDWIQFLKIHGIEPLFVSVPEDGN